MEQAIVATEKQGPHGSVEPVPHREAGHEDSHSVRVTDDHLTEKRRAHYGEDPAFKIPEHINANISDPNVNQVKDNKRNPIMVDQIRENNSGDMPGTSYGRAM